MQHTSLADVLSKLAFSEALPPNALHEIATVAVLQGFPAGHAIFTEGASCDTIYVVVSGRITLDMRVPGRGDVQILSLGSGDMLGWSALLEHGRMTATARVVEPSELIAVRASDLRALCDRDPKFGYLLMRQMAIAVSKRLLATRLQMLDLFANPSRAGASP